MQFKRHFITSSAFFLLLLGTSTMAWSVKYKVLHIFTEKKGVPTSGLTLDAQGNAYGTVWPGDTQLGGAVYKLSPGAGYQVIYHFEVNGIGGYAPEGSLVLDSAGNLYGTTIYGGNPHSSCGPYSNGCGVVFELSPPASGFGSWTETVLYEFCSQTNCADGGAPDSGVTFDSAGNLYGAAQLGSSEYGIVFKLSPNASGWSETVLYTFCSLANCADGALPFGNLVFDGRGNLYGTTESGGNPQELCYQYSGLPGCGTVFELTPPQQPLGAWTETTLYNFCSQPMCADGEFPVAGLTPDSSGNLYGTASQGGDLGPGCAISLIYEGCGAVFVLMPVVGGGWQEATVSTLFGVTPLSSLTIDSRGNLYSTTLNGGNYGEGNVFRLTKGTGGQWSASYFDLGANNCALGCWPEAPIVFDSAGNAYGTTTYSHDAGGVVFEISP